MARSPHDALFQFTFQQVQHATGLFRSILPPALVAAIDWSQLRLHPGSFVDKKLRRQQSDLLYSTQAGRRPVLLYLLTEHKSRSERWAVWQLAQYVYAIWRRQRQLRQRQLPLVFPILLHHGRRPWRAPRSLHDLLGGQDSSPSCGRRCWSCSRRSGR
jgi:predicted transposase/invertase (TIGR01784 family)